MRFFSHLLHRQPGGSRAHGSRSEDPRFGARRFLAIRLTLVVLLAFGWGASRAAAQRHSLGAAPPTAPLTRALPQGAVPALPMAPVAPVSAGMGALQFQPAHEDVPSPQVLTRQLTAGDDRARAGALASLGAPAQYTAHGRPAYPRSIQLDFVQLGGGDELDAVLTVQLDQHILSAVLVPTGEDWRRVATVSFASSFNNGTTTPSSFVRPMRSWLQPQRFRAVFHAAVSSPDGDFTENEADLRLINGRAVIMLDFVSGARHCDLAGELRPPHQICEFVQRWFDPDPADPTHRFVLITGTGNTPAHVADDPLSRSRNYRLTRLRSFSCQPFIFSDGASHFEPIAAAQPCIAHEPPHPEHAADRPLPDHP